MCFGKKEKPQRGASLRGKSGPRRAPSPPRASKPHVPSPHRASQPQAPGQPRPPSPPRAGQLQAPSQPRPPGPLQAGQLQAPGTPRPPDPRPPPSPSRASRPRVPGESRIPNQPQVPSNSPGPYYPITQGGSRADMPAAPPLGDARYIQPPQEPGQQAVTAPGKVTPGTEIVVAVVGVTGKIQSLFKIYIDSLR